MPRNVAQSLFARMIQRAVIRKDQMGTRANLHSLRCHRYPLGHQPIGFFEESLGIDHHAVAQYARFSLMDDA